MANDSGVLCMTLPHTIDCSTNQPKKCARTTSGLKDGGAAQINSSRDENATGSRGELQSSHQALQGEASRTAIQSSNQIIDGPKLHSDCLWVVCLVVTWTGAQQTHHTQNSGSFCS